MPSSAILLWQTCHISSLAPTMNLKNTYTNYLCLNRHVQILLSFYYNYQIKKKNTHTRAFYLSLSKERSILAFLGRLDWNYNWEPMRISQFTKMILTLSLLSDEKKKVPCKAKEKSPPNRIPKEKNKREQWKLGK